MNWDRARGNWKQVKGKVREEWGKLTDDDLEVIQGKRDQLVGKVQERYSVLRDEAEQHVAKWERRIEKALDEAMSFTSQAYENVSGRGGLEKLQGGRRAGTTSNETTSETSSSQQTLGEIAERLGGVVGEKLDDLHDQGKELYQQSKDRVQTASSMVGGYVQEQPLTALLMAAGVGLILGVILARR